MSTPVEIDPATRAHLLLHIDRCAEHGKRWAREFLERYFGAPELPERWREYARRVLDGWPHDVACRVGEPLPNEGT